MRRILLAFLLLGTVGIIGVAGQAVVVNYFASFHDHELPAAPCPTFDAPQPVSHDQTLILLYYCTDGRTIARHFSTEPPDTVPPPVGMATCPGPHRACSCLPAGTYYASWLETVGCGR